MYVFEAPAMSKQESKKGIALDTCVIRTMMENPNYTDMLSMRVSLRGVEVHVCPRVVDEMRQQGIAVGPMVGKLEGLGVHVVFGEVDARMRADAKAMVARYAPLLHWHDSGILAHAKARLLVLLTRDRDLETVAGMEGVEVINPDKLCGTSGRPNSSYENTAAAHSRRPPPDRGVHARRKKRRRNLPRRAAPLHA